MTNVEKFCKREPLEIEEVLQILRIHCKQSLIFDPIEATSVADYFISRFIAAEVFAGVEADNTRWVVWRDTVTNEHYKQEFPYNSYDGNSEEYSEWWHVTPRQITKTVYNISRNQYNAR